MNAGSPAIDTGTSIGALVDDFENDSRPTNGDANGTLVHDHTTGAKGVRWHENGPLIEWGEGRMGNVSLEWIYHD